MNNQKEIYVGCAVRISTDLDSQKESIPHQISHIKDYLFRMSVREDKKYVLKDEFIYKDEAVSGYSVSILERPAIKRMFQDIEAGRIQVIIFKNVSRFGRDSTENMVLYDELTRTFGIRVISIQNGVDSINPNARLMFGINSLIAERESDDISIRKSDGDREKARSGKWVTSTPPFGYDLDKETYKLIPNENAEVIRLIFNLYVNNLDWGMQRIAGYLNNDTPYKPMKADKWQAPKIRAILNNPVYKGYLVWGNTRNVIKRVNGVKKSVKAKTENPIIVENAFTPIVDKEIWEKANTKVKSRSKDRIRGSNAVHPLSGIAKCGACGNSMVYAGGQKKGTVVIRDGKPYEMKRDYGYYICNLRHSGKACNMPRIRDIDIERRLYLELTEKVEKYHKKVKLSNTEKKVNVEGIHKKIKKVEKEISEQHKALTDLYVDKSSGRIPESVYDVMSKNILENIDRLEKEKKLIINELNQFEQSKNQSKELDRIMSLIVNTDYNNKDELRVLFKTFFEKVIVLEKSISSVKMTSKGLLMSPE